MLPIVCANAYHSLIESSDGIALEELPARINRELELRGIMAPTSMFAGADADAIDRFRDAADKADCPCLFLLEDDPHPLGDPGVDRQALRDAVERMKKVLKAAHRMGCSAAGFSIAGPAKESTVEVAAERLAEIATTAEQLDLNLLIRPSKGFTREPEGVTDLIKKVGGFRLGSLPDFQAAGESGDPTDYLRRLAPYAPVVLAASIKFSDGEHEGYSLKECAEALQSVGYDGAVAYDYRGGGDVEEGLRRTLEATEEILFGTDK